VKRAGRASIGRAWATAAAGAAAIALAGCAAERPVVYPNPHFKSVGPAVAQSDIDQCVALARDYGVQPRRGGPDSGDVAVNTGVGAASGAARGAVYGHAGRGAAAGAAGAAAGSVVRGVFRPRVNQAHRRFVEQCLRDKGYQVTGWQ
jgi:hypothetical protein